MSYQKLNCLLHNFPFIYASKFQNTYICLNQKLNNQLVFSNCKIFISLSKRMTLKNRCVYTSLTSTTFIIIRARICSIYSCLFMLLRIQIQIKNCVYSKRVIEKYHIFYKGNLLLEFIITMVLIDRE